MVKRTIMAVGLVLFAALVYQFAWRSPYDKPTSDERSGAHHNWLRDGFSVALVWPAHSDSSLVEGATLALEEVNAAGGLLAGKIKLRTFAETDDDGAMARQVVAYPDVLTVIGHEIGGNAIPASVTYERHGVLFLAAKASDVRLTDHQFHYVFRMTLDDTGYAEALANYALARDWNRIAVLFGRSDHGEDASSAFLTVAKEVKNTVPIDQLALPDPKVSDATLAVAIVQSFFHEPDASHEDFRPGLAAVRTQSFDAVMLADDLPWAGKLIVDMSAMGITQPILATNKLDSSDTWGAAGAAGNNLYVVSAVNPDSTRPQYVAFRERFKKRFGVEPGVRRESGVRHVHAYARAVVKSGSADPLVVATTLRTNTWPDQLFGEVSFAPNGDVVGRTASIKHLQDGVFRTVPNANEKNVKDVKDAKDVK